MCVVNINNPMMYLVKEDCSVQYLNGQNSATGNYLTITYGSNYLCNIYAKEKCKIAYRYNSSGDYVEKEFSNGELIASIPYNSGSYFAAVVL